jgi:O-antigen ligase
MIESIKNFYLQLNKVEKLLLILFSLFPITFILGNFSINLIFFLISLIFIMDSIKSQKFFFIKDPIFWILSIFFISLVINLVFSIDPSNSTNRVLKIILVISFILQMKRFVQNHQIKFEKIILGFWSLIFLIVSLDGIFEIIFGFNTLGFSTPQEGRVAGFFGEELVLGGFFHCFCLIFISYIFYFFNKSNIFILLTIIFLIIISFLIGERSNFIKVFFSLSFLSLFIIKLKLRYFILSFVLLFSILFLFINFNYETKNRYVDQVKKIYETKEINSYLIKSPYGAHYNAAYKIFEEFPIFGVGVKNFRIESAKEKYRNDKYEWTQFRSTTHPHQIHLELLSETGIFGYVFFLIFILSSLYLSLRSYLKYRNAFQLSAMLYVIFYLAPILPSGSFFATFSSALFWVNYSVMISYIKK